MQADDTVGVNKHSDNSKLPSCPMKSQLMLQSCFQSANSSNTSWEFTHAVGVTNTTDES